MVCSIDIYSMCCYGTNHSEPKLQNGLLSLGRLTINSINIFFFIYKMVWANHDSFLNGWDHEPNMLGPFGIQKRSVFEHPL